MPIFEDHNLWCSVTTQLAISDEGGNFFSQVYPSFFFLNLHNQIHIPAYYGYIL